MNNSIRQPDSQEILTSALQLHQRGWTPVPLRVGSKKPALRDWSNSTYSDEVAVKSVFTNTDHAVGPVGPFNLGVALGKNSGGLVDVDLDHPLAPHVGALFLSNTPMRSGRIGSPRSHYWFLLSGEEDLTRQTWTGASSKDMVLEARGTGCQTVWPGSIHPSGEEVRWEGEPWAQPSLITRQELLVRCSLVGIVTILAAHWPGEGSRHEAYLALAGALLREGPMDHPQVNKAWLDDDRAEDVLRAVALVTHDRDGHEQRVKESIPSTIEKIRARKPVRGFPALAEMVGEAAVAIVRRYVEDLEAVLGHQRPLSPPEPLEGPGVGLGATPPVNLPQIGAQDSWGGDGEEPGQDDAMGVVRFEAAVQFELEKIRVREEAKRRYTEESEPAYRPEPILLGLMPDEEEAPPRIAKMLPADGSILLIAQAKTGKTALTLNMARCLLTGEDLLGALEVRPIEPHRRVAILNYEMTPAMIRSWARAHGVPEDRLVLINTRGQGNPLRRKEDRAWLGKQLHEWDVEVLILDTFSAAYTGDSQNDAGQVRRWLDELEHWVRHDVGASELIVTAHAGHQGNRARGSSSLMDWGDGQVILTRKEDPAGGPDMRFIRTQTRLDDDMKEVQTNWDEDTKTVGLMSQEEHVVSALRGVEDAIVRVLDEAEEDFLIGSEMEKRVRHLDVPRELIGPTRNGLLDRGVLQVESGPRNSRRWSLAPGWKERLENTGEESEDDSDPPW